MHGPGYPAGVRTDIWHPPRWWGATQPCKKGVRGAAPRIFFDDFLSVFGKKFLVLKDRILGNTEFQKTGSYVTGRPDNLSLSLRDVFNDVLKY